MNVRISTLALCIITAGTANAADNKKQTPPPPPPVKNSSEITYDKLMQGKTRNWETALKIASGQSLARVRPKTAPPAKRVIVIQPKPEEKTKA